MKRSYGRDFGLSLRMAVALGFVALIYTAGLGFCILLTAVKISDREWDAAGAGGFFGAAVLLALVGQLTKSESFVLRTARAEMLQPDEEPELQELVARVAAQADLPRPRVALIHAWAPNALTAGRKPETAVVAVTTELLRRLERHELEAVVAHELAHVANRDVPVMTFVAGPAMVGSFFWHLEDRVKARLIFMFYWPVYVLGLLLLWTISRYREYAADRGSALITGAPENLISALLKIEGGTPPRSDLRGGLAVQAFCIVSRRSRRRFELMMDHPPMSKRIARLEELARVLGKAEA